MFREKFLPWKGTESIFAALILFSAVSCGEASSGTESSPPERKKISSRKNLLPRTAAEHRKKKSSFRSREEGSLKVRVASDPQASEKVEVEIDHSNVTFFPGSRRASASPDRRRVSRKEQKLLDSLRGKRPSTTLSAGIASAHPVQNIRWSPRMRSDTSRRSRIECCALSTDGSVILFVESVGAEQGPCGSRLVFLDTYSWKILSVHHLKEHYVKAIAFLRDGSCLLSCRGQESLRSKDTVLHFDPVLLRILNEFKVDGLRKAWGAPSGRHFFVTYRKESASAREIACYVLDGSDTGRVCSVSGGNTEPVLAFSADGKTLYSCGDTYLESYTVRKLKLQRKTALPPDFVCSDLLVLDPGTLVAAPEEGLRQKMLLIRNSVCKSFGESSAGSLFTLPPPRQQSEFGALLSRKGKVGCFALPALDETLEVFPEECRERTVGNPWRVFVLKHCPEAFAVLDQSGNFYLLYRGKNERRFRKEILISSMGRKKKR